MITFEKLLERTKTEKVAIHTSTEEQAKILLEALDKKGYEWLRGEKLTDKTYYGVFRENTCYDFEPNDKICHSSLSFLQGYRYTIIEFTDIDFEENV